MTGEIFVSESSAALNTTSSSLAISAIIQGDMSEGIRQKIYEAPYARNFEAETFTANYNTYKFTTSSSATNADSVQIVRYVSLLRYPLGEIPNSSANLSETVREYYDKIGRQLRELSNPKSGIRAVDEGAVQSALKIADLLRGGHYPPPELSWHGGDAVVMLWTLGDTTCAITITDGEVGYVIRRNRQAIKMRAAIEISTFWLPSSN